MSQSTSAIVTYSRMIKLSHSIFAMPFALAAAVLAAREVEVTVVQIALIVACMVLARSSAMGFNRLVDKDIDAANPRTASRELVTGAAIMYPFSFGPGRVDGRTLTDDDITAVSFVYPTGEFVQRRGSISGRVTKGGRGVAFAHIVAFAERISGRESFLKFRILLGELPLDLGEVG